MKIVYLIFWLLALQLISCKPEKGECRANFFNKSDDRLTIVNNSSKAITYSFSYDYPEDSGSLHIFVPNQLVIDANDYLTILPNSSGRYTARGGCWEGRFKNTISSGILRIMIFEIDSIKALPASEVISRGLYKNYLYTLDQLKVIDWQVVYP